MILLRFLGAGLLGMCSFACGSNAPEEPPSCTADLPSACPPSPPSYQNDVRPILEARCNDCHRQGGDSHAVPLTSYDWVYARRSSVLSRVYLCTMPPASAPSRLETQERATLLAWLECGAPEN